MDMKRILIAAVILVTATGICWADTTDNLSKENADLKKRVDRLERELAELRDLVMQQAKATQQKPVVVAQPNSTATPQLSEADYQRILAMVLAETEKKNPVWSSLDIQLYGFIKLDAAYDSSRMSFGNYARWVESEASNDNDNEFNMTANETRLGLKISGPEDDGVKTSGVLEIDFFEDSTATNKARIMMRHAYMKIDWPEDRFSIIAGQTWDVISPLNPSTLNYSVQWWAGNIGYRRPQIRLTKSFALTSDIDLTLQGAIARTVGISNSFDTPGDSGEDAGFPGVQGRASLKFPLLGYKPTVLGVSGHWAKEELDDASPRKERHFDSWSLNLDLVQPINKWITVKGELFTGENLSAYLGGIGQGINTTTHKEIGSTGGWIAASLGPWDKWRFNVGVSADDVDNSDVAGNSTLREYNSSIFGNAIYSINKNTQVGFELSQWRTKYAGSGDADSIRAQTSFIYKF